MTTRWTSARVRATFLDFFRSQGYSLLPSSSIKPPHGDRSLNFVNAGMNQFKPIFLNEDPLPEYLKNLRCVANTQKCIRVGGKHNDLSQVGLDGHHHTFFEMLGHWSFNGALSKKTTMQQAWSLLTDVFGIDKSRLFITCFQGNSLVPRDEETAALWTADLGVSPDRVSFLDEKENFWDMGDTGPCGPCTEIHYSWTDPPRFECSQELWNLVFIQYNRESENELTKLPNFHVDTGLGLERLCKVLQNVRSNYETDLFSPIMKTLNSVLPHLPPYRERYGINDVDKIDRSYRLLADHARAVVIALSDGMVLDNSFEGNIVKSLQYRSVNRILKLGGKPGVFVPLCQTAAEILGPIFPEIPENLSKTIDVVSRTVSRSHKVLKKGRSFFKSKLLPKIQAENRRSLLPDEIRALRLEGLPYDVICDIAVDNNLTVDIKT